MVDVPGVNSDCCGLEEYECSSRVKYNDFIFDESEYHFFNICFHVLDSL